MCLLSQISGGKLTLSLCIGGPYFLLFWHGSNLWRKSLFFWEAPQFMFRNCFPHWLVPPTTMTPRPRIELNSQHCCFTFNVLRYEFYMFYFPVCKIFRNIQLTWNVDHVQIEDPDRLMCRCRTTWQLHHSCNSHQIFGRLRWHKSRHIHKPEILTDWNRTHFYLCSKFNRRCWTSTTLWANVWR